MRYSMMKKLFSFGNKYVIKDELERDVFFVDGEVFSLGNKLSFQDMAGNELAYIQQKLFSWGPNYEIFRNGQLYATINKELFTFFQCKFNVDVPGPDDLTAKGDFLDHEYTISRGGFPVAQISKQWFTWTNTYGVDVANGQDDILMLVSTVVIDLCCHESNH